MGKFFNDQDPLAGFEEFLSKTKKPSAQSSRPNDSKEYEGGKTYSFLEFNYYRLKKLAALLHKKLFNLGSDDFFEATHDEYQKKIKAKRKKIIDTFVQPEHSYQFRQKEIYEYFFTRK